MKCEDALVLMLDAEPGDLVSGAGDLGVHIGSCPKCFAVAKTLRGETNRLAVAFASSDDVVSAAEFRARRGRVRRVIPMALAASILLVLAIRNQSPTATETPATLDTVSAPIVDTLVAPVQAARPIVSAAPALPVLVRMPAAVPTAAVAVQAIAVEATTATSTTEIRSAAPEIAVDPEPGTRATIWRYPNVTVVWLDKNSSR